MKPFLLLLLTLAGCLPAFTLSAQYLIQGKITDAHGNVLPVSTLVLQRSTDSTVVRSMSGDTAGMFKISVLHLRKLCLRVLSPGFISQVHTVADTVGPVQMNFSLLPDTKALQGITVNARKPVIEQKIDRTVFNVENSVSSAGADGLDVLKKAPGVIVTNNDIAIAGRGTVGVMLNGRLQQLSNDELQGLLKSIPAENIARIEVISTPPSQYDAQGNSGLINIVTRKSLKAGLNGNVTGSYQRTSSGTIQGNGNISYRQDKWNVYANGSGMHGWTHPVSDFKAFYPGQTSRQVDHDNVLNDFGRYQFGVDYNITPSQILGVQYTIGYGSPAHNESTLEQIFNEQHGLDSSSLTTSHTYSNGLRHVVDVNYEWKIDSTGRKLTIDGDYFNRTSNRKLDFTTHYFRGAASEPGQDPTTNRTAGVQTVHIRAVKADVEWPSKLVNLSFGGKASFIYNVSDNIYSSWNGHDFENNAALSNVFDYTENTQALYISGSRSIQKWQFQAGLRGEYTETKGVSQTIQQTNKNEYGKLFPTLYIKYAVSEDHSLSLNYDRRIERPSFWMMNPFRMYSTPTSYTEGNPFLQPSFSNKLELTYGFRSLLTFTLFTQAAQHTSIQVSTVDTATTSLRFTQENAGTLKQYGVRINFNFTVGNWWESSLECDGFQSHFSSDFYKGSDMVNYHKFSSYMEMSNTFYFNNSKTFMASLDGWLTTPTQEDFDHQQTVYNISTGIRVITLKKKMTLGLNVNDIFASERYRSRNLYNGMLLNMYNDERNVRLSCTYKFGSRQKAPRVRSDMEENKR